MALFPKAKLRLDDGPITGAALIDYLRDADGAIVGLEPVDEALLTALPELRIVAKYGVGLDNVDQAACARHGVAVGWTPGVNARSVAEMTLCFMLGLARNIFHTSTLLRSATWHKRGGVLLSGRTVGIIGLGHIGQEVVRLLNPFGCRVLANDIADRSDFMQQWSVLPADKETIYRECDIVSLHVPLTPDTRHLIDAAALSLFKPGTFLINTARGPVVSQSAVHEALRDGRLSGAALDVFENEPPADLNFLNLPKLVATPHIGGNADEAVVAMGLSAIAHLRSFFLGSRI